jgi:AcrR family transcriptional regulator
MERSGAAAPETGMGPDRRDQILVMAVQLFRTRGYDRTSLREIAGNLGLSKSGLYHHFPSKDALLASLVEPLLDDLGALLQDHPGELEASDRRSFLARYLDILLAHRSVVSLIGREPAVAADARIGSRLTEINAAVQCRLAGPHPDLAQEIRAVHAVAGLQDAVVRFADADPAVVRAAGLAAAVAALSGS